MKHLKKIIVALVALLCVALCCLTGCAQEDSNLEKMDLLKQALQVIEQNYIGEMDIDRLDFYAARAVLDNLDDFTYLTDSLYSKTSSATIGIHVKITPYNEYFVEYVVPSSPADTVFDDGFHLQRGDEIYAVTNSNYLDDEGQPVRYRLRGLDSSAYATFVSGDEETTLTLGVYRNGLYVGDYLYTKAQQYLPRAYYIGDVYGAESDVGYIRLMGFSNVEVTENNTHVVHSSAEDFDRCMQQFMADGKKKLVLDLRGNGGGDVKLLAQVAAYFVPLGDKEYVNIMQLEYAKTNQIVNVSVQKYKEDQDSEGVERYIPDLPLVILCNSSTASAAECLIGACRAYHPNTTVIGTKTYGKGVFQRTGITLYDTSSSSEDTGILDRYYVVMVSGYYYVIDPSVEGGRYCVHNAPLSPDISITPGYEIGDLAQDPEMVQAKTLLEP